VTGCCEELVHVMVAYIVDKQWHQCLAKFYRFSVSPAPAASWKHIPAEEKTSIPKCNTVVQEQTDARWLDFADNPPAKLKKAIMMHGNEVTKVVREEEISDFSIPCLGNHSLLRSVLDHCICLIYPDGWNVSH